MIDRITSHQGTGSLRAARFFFGQRFWYVGVVMWLAYANFVSAWGQPAQPEGASGFLARPAAIGTHYMAATANPLATEAALEILELGGNALDAAIAAQWVLNLVEPQSSGVGGGGFLLYWNATQGRLSAWDGRETAPQALPANFGQRPDGSPKPFLEIVGSGEAVGIPGLVAMLEAAHRAEGKIRWARLAAPAIRLARNGFPVSPRLHVLLREELLLRQDRAAAVMFYGPDGAPYSSGTLLRNPDFADFLSRLAGEGSAALYRGETAQRLVQAVASRGGSLAISDLEAYRPRQRTALCGPYRSWRVCGMPPPSSGGVAVLQLLGILERSGAAVRDPDNGDLVHRFAESGRLAYADRNRYLADPDFVSVPLNQLLDPAYLARRAALISRDRSMGRAAPGALPSVASAAESQALEIPATTHLSIVDRDGNAVALTSSIEASFGSRVMVDGFLLNNQLTDFALAPATAGVAANRPAPGKRPLSSMSPTMVFAPDGRLHLVIGSPGGARIINYVARSLIAILDGGLAPDAALALGHVGSRNGPTEVERGRVSSVLVEELRRRHHVVDETDMTSGLHAIVRQGSRWIGAADPRREGLAGGN